MTPESIAVLIRYGPEARAFLYSGLVDRLQTLRPVTLFAECPGSAAFEGVSAPVHPAPTDDEGRFMERIRGAARRLRGQGVRIASTWERGAARVLGGVRAWREAFRRRRICCVLATSYSAARALPALQTAANLGLPSIVAVNSWKDVFDKPYAAAPPAALAVAGKGEVARFRAANPGFRGLLEEAGSLHLNALARARGRVDEATFRRRLGLDPLRPIVLFSAAAGPAGIPEERWIEALADICEGLPDRPQLLIRANPMDPGRRFPCGAVWRPDWEWSAERDWCCPLPGDAAMWTAAINAASSAVCAPSTTALEFAWAGKRVVNLGGEPCWDALWSAPHYAEARRRGWVVRIDSVDELRRAISRPADRVADRPNDDAVEQVFALVRGALRGGGIAAGAAA